MQAVPLYLSEMSLPRHRGAISNGFQMSLGIGFLTANLVNYGTQKIKAGWGWRISLSVVGIPASILTLGALFLPETPNSIIQRSHNPDQARKTLQKIRGTHDVQTELDDLIAAAHISKTMKNPYRNILTPKFRPQLVMAIAMPLFQIFTGQHIIIVFLNCSIHEVS